MPSPYSLTHHLLYRRAVILAADERLRLDTAGRLVRCVQAQCASGVLDLWIGEADPNDLPDARFQPGMGPQRFWLEPAVYLFTLSSPLGCRAVLTFLGD